MPVFPCRLLEQAICKAPPLHGLCSPVNRFHCYCPFYCFTDHARYCNGVEPAPAKPTGQGPKYAATVATEIFCILPCKCPAEITGDQEWGLEQCLMFSNGTRPKPRGLMRIQFLQEDKGATPCPVPRSRAEQVGICCSLDSSASLSEPLEPTSPPLHGWTNPPPEWKLRWRSAFLSLFDSSPPSWTRYFGARGRAGGAHLDAPGPEYLSA